MLGLALAIGLALCAYASPVEAQKLKILASLDSLETRAQADSNDPTAHYDLALGYWDKKRFDDAERQLREAIAIAPQYADALLAIGVLPRARGEKYWKHLVKRIGAAAADSAFQHALRAYRRAFLINPLVDLRILGKYDESWGVAFVVTKKGGEGPTYWFLPLKGWWNEPHRKAMNAFREGRYDVAYDRFTAIVKDSRAGTNARSLPDEVVWYHGLSAAHLELHNVALGAFRELLQRAMAQIDSSSAIPLGSNEYRYVLATLTHRANRLDEAEGLYREVLEQDIGLYTAHVQLARIFESKKMWNEAIDERNRAIDTNPEDPSLLLDLGGTLAQTGRWSEAAEVLERACAANPRDARGPYLLGLAAQKLGNRDSARAAFRRFLAIAPSKYAQQITEVREWLALLQ